MSLQSSIFVDNRKKLSELYFKAVGEKEVLKRTIEFNHDLDESELVEYSQLSNLVANLRIVLGTVTAVP